MTREQFLKDKIINLGSIKDFSEKINMPYTTLLSILKNVGGASIDNIFKICKGLNITADDLNNSVDENYFSAFNFSTEERDLIIKYRCLSQEGKIAVQGTISGLYDATIKSKIKKDTVG